MIEINLLPDDLRENIDFSKKNRETLKILKVVILLCVFTLASLLICGASLLSSNQFFLKEIGDSNKVISSYNSVVDEKQKVEEKAKSVEKIRAAYKYFTKFDYILGVNVPEGIYIGSLETQNDTLKMTGYAKSKNDIGIFRDALESEDSFSNVNIDSIKETDDPSKQGTTVNSFNINAKLERSATSKGATK